MIILVPSFKWNLFNLAGNKDNYNSYDKSDFYQISPTNELAALSIGKIDVYSKPKVTLHFELLNISLLFLI